MNKDKLSNETILRIRRMEFYFDTLRSAAETVPHLLREDDPVRDMLRELVTYYEGGQWLRDYEADEQGLLPKGLKRGVLSQDGVFELLSEIQNHGSDI